MRTRSVREVLERLTLRKIVALGLAATGDAVPEDATMRIPERQSPELAMVSYEDPALAASADRRKARLRSLLDEL